MLIRPPVLPRRRLILRLGLLTAGMVVFVISTSLVQTPIICFPFVFLLLIPAILGRGQKAIGPVSVGDKNPD